LSKSFLHQNCKSSQVFWGQNILADRPKFLHQKQKNDLRYFKKKQNSLELILSLSVTFYASVKNNSSKNNKKTTILKRVYKKKKTKKRHFEKSGETQSERSLAKRRLVSL
jgi:hypothetical protein